MSVYTDPSGKKRPITPRKLGVGSLVLAVGIGVTVAVTPGGRDRIVVAVAWITMPDAAQATELRRLIDTPGTGSIRPLDRRIELTGQHYASRQEGELVTVAEAEPDGRSVPGRVLEEVAEDAAR